MPDSPRPDAPGSLGAEALEATREARSELGPTHDEMLLSQISRNVYGNYRASRRLSIDDILTDDGKTLAEEDRDSARMLGLIVLGAVFVVCCCVYVLLRWLA